MIQTTCHAGQNEWALAIYMRSMACINYISMHAMNVLGSQSKSSKMSSLVRLCMEGIDRSLSVNHSIIHNTEEKEF